MTTTTVLYTGYLTQTTKLWARCKAVTPTKTFWIVPSRFMLLDRDRFWNEAKITANLKLVNNRNKRIDMALRSPGWQTSRLIGQGYQCTYSINSEAAKIKICLWEGSAPPWTKPLWQRCVLSKSPPNCCSASASSISEPFMVLLVTWAWNSTIYRWQNQLWWAEWDPGNSSNTAVTVMLCQLFPLTPQGRAATCLSISSAGLCHTTFRGTASKDDITLTDLFFGSVSEQW